MKRHPDRTKFPKEANRTDVWTVYAIARNRTATVSKRRHVICYVAFKPFGWPSWIKESINVDFDGEVGERTGSWKGGTIGCGYDLLPDETMLDALRRMERNRTFN